MGAKSRANSFVRLKKKVCLTIKVLVLNFKKFNNVLEMRMCMKSFIGLKL